VLIGLRKARGEDAPGSPALRVSAGVTMICILAGCLGSAPARSTPARGARPSTTTTTPATATPIPASTVPSGVAPGGATPVTATKPNIVFVLTDDLSRDLVRYMPAVKALARRGMSFRNYFVSDSLCCPSRSSIFTGQFPHNTGVFNNTGADGGIGAFYGRGDERHAFNISLQKAGYRTAMMGKYLNGYLQPGSPVPGTYVPPGWSEWDVAGWGYREYDYPMNQNGKVVQFGHSARAYLTSVLTRRGVRFINRAADARQPFFLELATFAPHSPYVPAPRDTHAFPDVTAPRPPNFNVLPRGAPNWLGDHPPLTPERLQQVNRVFRRRVQDVQSTDRMLATIEAAIAHHGLTRDTYVVFSSDNGLHTGEYRLMPGKLTAYDTDIHVPLVIAGPGVAHGTVSNAMTENVDLAETFTAIGGRPVQADGHSLLGPLHGGSVADWRNAILVEHHGPDLNPANPDRQTGLSGNPISYEAMRTSRFLYVEYRDGEREFYDLRNDPFELHNLAADLIASQLAQLHAELARLEACHGQSTCWSAGHVAQGPTS
jgi:N-acetylglucosamine-6-sulfatase